MYIYMCVYFLINRGSTYALRRSTLDFFLCGHRSWSQTLPWSIIAEVLTLNLVTYPGRHAEGSLIPLNPAPLTVCPKP